MSPSFRDFVDPVSSKVEEHPTRTGTIVIAVSLLIIVLAVLHKFPIIDSQSGYTIRADFAKVNQVNDRTPVRVDGVNVGTVSGVGAGPNALHSSELKMLITQSGLVIHQDATASIRWRTVLGGTMFVDLKPGSPDAPKLNGPIPLKHTSDQTELDDVLRVYNGNTDQAQRDMLKGLSATFAAPKQIGTSINTLPDLTTVGQGLKPYGGTDPGDLSKLVANTGRTANALGASTTNLQNLVDGADQTLAATDDQQVALGRTLQLGPGTLNSTQVTSKRLITTLNHLDPLVRKLEPGSKLIYGTTQKLQPALNTAREVLNDAQPLLNNARPALTSLSSAATTGTPLLKSLSQPVSRLNSNILPWLQERSDDTKIINYESIGPFFSVLDEAAAEYDSSGYRLHLSTLAGSASVIDESLLTSGLGALSATKSSMMSECVRVAPQAQAANCGAVSQLLTGMLMGRAK